ncbi:MAG: DUF481 domain-containing protein [Verrucomicrobiota bacterium JB022]|nr:DUF481 domain-containing protein [Verrucomicrobiota bacterium JB022]
MIAHLLSDKAARASRALLLGSLALMVSSLAADEVRVSDGSVLKGTIEKIHDGKVHLKTAYAGTLVIPQDQVVSFMTDEPVAVRLEGGNVAQGPVRPTAGNQLQIQTNAGTMTSNVGAVEASWPAGGTDPDVAATEAALRGQLRTWAYQASLDLSGKAGNTEKTSTSARVQATLEGPSDRLRLYSAFEYANDGDDTTAKEIIGGFNYTNFFTEKWGWYVREELEKDEFEGIDLRSLTGAGANYRFYNYQDFKLEGRTGLSYRYESYVPVTGDNPDTPVIETTYTPDSEGYLGLDFGLDLYWKFAAWGDLQSKWTYTPAFEDFNQYIVQQDTSVNIPLAFSDQWKLGIGVSNTYNSKPEGDKENLDTTYFTRLILNWK